METFKTLIKSCYIAFSVLANFLFMFFIVPSFVRVIVLIYISSSICLTEVVFSDYF